MSAGVYRVKEFAALAGVTVRALHHYDRLGLLQPRRTASGSRIYTCADLERLEAIVALKLIGLPLREIRAVIAADSGDLAGVLRRQLSALEEKKRRLSIAIGAIRAAEAMLQGGNQPNLIQIIEVIEMQNDRGWILQHFTDAARPSVEQRLASATPEGWAALQHNWNALAADMIAALDEDPASRGSQALLNRWEALVRETTGNDEALIHGLKSLYAGRDNWPEPIRQALEPMLDDRIVRFVQRAAAARTA